MTLDDLELLQGQILSEFPRISHLEANNGKTNEGRPILSAMEL